MPGFRPTSIPQSLRCRVWHLDWSSWSGCRSPRWSTCWFTDGAPIADGRAWDSPGARQTTARPVPHGSRARLAAVPPRQHRADHRGPRGCQRDRGVPGL